MKGNATVVSIILTRDGNILYSRDCSCLRAYDHLYRREVIHSLGRDWRRRLVVEGT